MSYENNNGNTAQDAPLPDLQPSRQICHKMCELQVL